MNIRNWYKFQNLWTKSFKLRIPNFLMNKPTEEETFHKKSQKCHGRRSSTAAGSVFSADEAL